MLKITKPTTRETDCYDRGLPIIKEDHPKYLSLRLKGQRNDEAVNVPWDVILEYGRKSQKREMQLDGARPRKKAARS